MNSEWYIPETSVPVRQGDILISRDPKNGSMEDICIVITADCDINNEKFGRQLACLRIITLERYLRTIWSDRKLRDFVANSKRKILEQVNKWHTQKSESKVPLSVDAVTAWVNRAKGEEICADLKVPQRESKKLQSSLTSFREALSFLNDDPDKLRQLVSFRAAFDGKNHQETWGQVLNQAKNEKLPEDVFLLPSLPQLEIGSAVVLLREIVGVPTEVLCYRTSDACTKEKYLRVGRLEPAFKYAVSQAFGSLYARIGLTKDYETRCKEVINLITEISWE